jgi:hypothetical protein
MSTDLTTQQQNDMGAFDPADESMLRYLNLNPADPKSRAAIAVCRRYNLDPVLKHVVVIPGGGVFITRDGLLHIAHRSGQLDGIVVEQDPTLDGDEWKCKVSVYRKDMRFPFTFPGRYPQNGGNKKYAQEMALKVAESHAYRRAFDINGLPTLDEHEADATDQPTTVKPRGMDAVRAAVQPQEPAPEQPVEDVHDADVVEDRSLTDHTRKKMFALLSEIDPEATAETQRAGMSVVLGRPIKSRTELSEDDAQRVIDALNAEKRKRAIAAEMGEQA